MQVADSSVASRTDGVAELKRQLDVADADITLVNRRLDESQGRFFSPWSPSKGAEDHFLQHVCFMQMVPLLWRAFGQN